MKPFFSRIVSVDALSSRGFGTAFVERQPGNPPVKALIPGALPGEIVEAEFGPKRQGRYIGRLSTVKEPSQHRVPSACIHAAVCGGCSLLELSYEEQLRYKETSVRKLFPFFPEDVFLPITPSREIFAYRNKMEFTFSQDKEGRRFLGLARPLGKGKIETIENCRICPPEYNAILESVRRWWEKTDLAAYHPYSDRGSLLTLTIREGRNTGDKMVILTVSGRPEFAIPRPLLTEWTRAVQNASGNPPETLSMFLRIRQAIPGQPTQFYEMKLAGPDHIRETLTILVGDEQKSYSFLISPSAFFQPNTLQAEVIYSEAFAMIGTKKRKKILDLYAGTATLGIIASSFAEEVISVEINPYAVFDARANAEHNGIGNIRIEQGDVADILASLEGDLVIVDPPRSGLGTKSVEILGRIGAKEILYISCSPPSQAEDCKKLMELGYRPVACRPVDQFPHTVHVENIIFLRKE